MIKQRSRSADALDLLKDGTMFEEVTAGVGSAEVLDAVMGHESNPTVMSRNTQPTPTAASGSEIVGEVGVTKNSSSGDASGVDVSAIAERHQQEQLDEAWDTLAVLLQEHDPTETCNRLPNTLPREYSRKRKGDEIEKSIGKIC
jgi:hypothetical protein